MARLSKLKKKADDLFRAYKLNEAHALYLQLHKQLPDDFDVLHKLANILEKRNLLRDSLKYYQKAIEINPKHDESHASIANIYYLLNDTNHARTHCERAINSGISSANIYFTLANINRSENNFDTAEYYYAKAVELKPDFSRAHFHRGEMQCIQGRPEAAAHSYDEAIRFDPTAVEAKWNKHRLLHVIHRNEEELNESRRIYSEGLSKIEEMLNLETKSGIEDACKCIKTSTNFYLQYQGHNDKDLQKRYGDIIQKTMHAKFPNLASANNNRDLKGEHRIRVGYASAFLRNHNGAVWLLGWLKERNINDFKIYCYHTGTVLDAKTEEFRSNCDVFRHIPDNIDSFCNTVIDDSLDILVYPEIGMDPQSIMTASLRLAPIQCVGWGHPITSGLGAIDYWISSDLMEPGNADEHYTETLIRLPNLANNYSDQQQKRLSSNLNTKKRSELGLPESSIIYLCSQSLFKYLPQYDHLWPEIAKRVPGCKFVFLAISSVHVIKKFMDRIESAFDAHNLNAKDYCIMLNRLSESDYLSLNKVADIFLDNPPWSGNNTSMAAIDACLPIVTYPTLYMRGRHAYAILKMAGLTELIADSEKEYIEIASKLGVDRVYRESIKTKIYNNRHAIYNDTTCVVELENFYKRIAS